jgi:hypothetical protein
MPVKVRRYLTGCLDTSALNSMPCAILSAGRTRYTFKSASLGFEPRQRDPESLVLPLHYEATALQKFEYRNPKQLKIRKWPKRESVFFHACLRPELSIFRIRLSGFTQLPRTSSSPSRAASTSSSFPLSRTSRRASSTMASTFVSS